jgi:hypothetical protein
MKLNYLQIFISLFVAIILSQFLHELTHAFLGILVGAENVQVHFFAANALQSINEDEKLKVIIVEGSAVLLNIFVGIIALFTFSKLAIEKAWIKYTAFLTLIFSFSLGFGYLLFDGIFYSPGTAGDFKAILDLFDGSLLLRLQIIIIGTIGWIWTLFFASQKAWVFVENESDKVRSNVRILLVPYFASSVLITLLAFVSHPLGVEGGVIVAMQYFFGNSLLFTGFLMSSYWLDYNKEVL